MEERVVALHAQDIAKASKIASKKQFEWLYLGQNVRQREKISQTLGKGNRYSMGRRLQDVAHQQKAPFLDFIADLGTHQKNPRNWWASNIAYKSPLASDLFLFWCYTTIFEKLCSEKTEGENDKLLILIEDRWLYRHLWSLYGNGNCGIRFQSHKSIFSEMLKALVRGVGGRGYFLIKSTYKVWQTRRIAPKSKTTNTGGNGGKFFTYSWIQDRSFQSDGKFEDAYFGRLADILSESGFGVTRITPPFLSVKLKRQCSPHDFIFLDQYIGYGDIFKSLFTFLYISCNGNQKWFRTLLVRQMLCEISSFPTYILYYSAFKNWLKETTGEDITIIYPFENQPWEKMLCLAVSEVTPKTKLIGYQHSTIPLLLLNYFLGANEASIMPLPKAIVTTGEYSLNLFRQSGYDEVEFFNGGTLRFEYFFDALERSPS